MGRKPWQDKERTDAKLFGSKATPRSGGLWFAKADSKSEQFLIENKTTAKANFTIQGKVWEKISREAVMERRVPILSIEFGNHSEVVVLDKNDFLEMLAR